MKTVSIHDAKTNLSKYIAAAKRGESIYIGSHGTPEVKLTVAKCPGNRKFGNLAGKVQVSPDFDDIPPELTKSITKSLNENTY